ncbi:ABC transporter permease [Nocardia beijingensis]|uniref:ABC transporter permease n=1 Tax=Nocardia beijingensis TaxID=95162 RepID=UPI0018956458|nr:ABC transporter permease subunit [Nocardia beijingensis]MBF6076881.1 ABC transporter permease subunit [Nocardia beijingensis]
MTTTADTAAVRADATAAATPPQAAGARRYPPTLGFALAWAVWALTAVVTLAVPDEIDVAAPLAAGVLFTAWTAALTGWAAYAYRDRAATLRLRYRTPWIAVLGAWVLFWEFATAKTGWLQPPHFASPQQMLLVFYSDAGLLASSTWHSMLLLAVGFVIGAVAGLSTGIALGWSRLAAYWGNPVLQTVGPVPAGTLLPVVLVLFPTTYSGSVFMVAFGVWFPVAVLTRAGIAGVARGYFDVAQTLGASKRFLVWRVAVPGALPSIFTGLFMGLGASLAALAVAELLGVKNGLGWYIQWTKGWAAYPRMYAAIVIMVVVCRTLMLLLFRVRNRVLAWEKDLVRW